MRTNGLRVEASKPVASALAVTETVSTQDWRKVAIQTGERLQMAEASLKDVRKAADENRARLTKAKERLDSAQARVNELQAELVQVKAANEDYQTRMLTQEQIKRAVWSAAQQAKDGLDRAVNAVLETL
jgi:chromosome segregation ATPase